MQCHITVPHWGQRLASISTGWESTLSLGSTQLTPETPVLVSSTRTMCSAQGASPIIRAQHHPWTSHESYRTVLKESMFTIDMPNKYLFKVGILFSLTSIPLCLFCFCMWNASYFTWQQQPIIFWREWLHLPRKKSIRDKHLNVYLKWLMCAKVLLYSGALLGLVPCLCSVV